MRTAIVMHNGYAPPPRAALVLLAGAAAHQHGRTCHVGRVSSAKRLRLAMSAGVDSGDSALPLWGECNLRPYLAALRGPTQGAWDFDGASAFAGSP